MIAKELQESFLFWTADQTSRSIHLKRLRAQPHLLQRLTQALRAAFQPAAQVFAIATHGVQSNPLLRITGTPHDSVTDFETSGEACIAQ